MPRFVKALSYISLLRHDLTWETYIMCNHGRICNRSLIFGFCQSHRLIVFFSCLIQSPANRTRSIAERSLLNFLSMSSHEICTRLPLIRRRPDLLCPSTRPDLPILVLMRAFQRAKIPALGCVKQCCGPLTHCSEYVGVSVEIGRGFLKCFGRDRQNYTRRIALGMDERLWI